MSNSFGLRVLSCGREYRIQKSGVLFSSSKFLVYGILNPRWPSWAGKGCGKEDRWARVLAHPTLKLDLRLGKARKKAGDED
ncbi:MAG: hypothetical protein A2Y07_02885 [Planctomycetes bacterium GWF2_50_10]|nr:MAG: hypothetical protein A2Y07_02885 [Planctomycetes bacterium GWF2_50_10]